MTETKPFSASQSRSSQAVTSEPLPQTPSSRLVSVDVFRGATIIAMILVNNPGNWNNVYAPLLHASWHGWTPTDLIFPFFLFVVGTAIVLALGRRMEEAGDDRPTLRKNLLGKIFRRSMTLFGLGLFLSGYPFGLFGSRTFERLLETWRIPGVLQRIALCYLVVALMFLFLRPLALRIWTGVFLLGYWLLMTRVPVPGLGSPDLASKGDHLAGWLDRLVFGKHLWISAKVYDPEGLLSTVPAFATTLFGVFAGLLLISRREPMEKAARLLVTGICLAVTGSVWGWFFPINKALWTSSYALLTAGLAFCALGICFWFFDLQEHSRLARPFTVYGVNSITVFVGSGILARTLGALRTSSPDSPTFQSWIYQTGFASWLPPYQASLAYAMAWILGWFAVLLFMNRRGWAWKV